jgi:hypothetical protein
MKRIKLLSIRKERQNKMFISVLCAFAIVCGGIVIMGAASCFVTKVLEKIGFTAEEIETM